MYKITGKPIKARFVILRGVNGGNKSSVYTSLSARDNAARLYAAHDNEPVRVFAVNITCRDCGAFEPSGEYLTAHGYREIYGNRERSRRLINA